jgi:AraC family transcriptional activator of pobA
MPILTQPETLITIPSYTLQQSSGIGSTMIEVIEANDHVTERNVNFLIPHRKNYYLMVFVKKGNSSRHWIDFTPYNLKPDTFYFTVPHQVLIKEEAKPLNGFLLCFTNEFLQLEGNNSLRNLPIIKNPDNGHELNLLPQDVDFVEDMMRKMYAEFKAGNDWRNQMLQAYLRVLLIYMSRLYTEQFTQQALIPDKVLLKKFQSLIEDNYRAQHHVAAYADMLNISAGHLNDVVKQQGGKTAITHIHERLMVEAKRMLMHTELSVKQIAHELGFDDSAYFNRFFKRLAKDTPMVYRTKIREMYS